MADIEWPLIIPADDAQFWAAASPDEKTQAEAWAAAILWALTGRIYGTQLDTVRPCHRPPRRGSTYDGTLHPRGYSAVYGAGALGLPILAGTDVCSCSGDCRHQTAADLAVPGPIQSVTEILIDGVAVPAGDYKIRNHRWIRRTDGKGWPTRQNLNAADDEVGAFAVTYRKGIVPPQIGQLAGGVMAVEYLRDRAGQECRLPRGVVSANRNGLQVELDPRAFFSEGLTGIDEVDQWIISVNPSGLAEPARMVPAHPTVTRFGA